MSETKNNIIAVIAIISAVLLVALLFGCNLEPNIAPFNPDTPIDTVDQSVDTISQPIVLDSCTEYVEVTEPAFVNTTVEILEAVTNDVTVSAGPYTAAVPLTAIGGTVDSLMKLFRPAYYYTTYIKQSDPRVFTTIIDGTNDHEQFLLKCLLKYNGVKHYFGAASQAFYFAGALDAEQTLNTSIKYPSVNRFNDRGTDFDSLTQEKIDTTRLGHCKAGREWSDFRWGIHSDSIIDLFIQAGWNTVLSAAPPNDEENMVIDLSHYRADEMMILYYLRQGYQVITKE